MTNEEIAIRLLELHAKYNTFINGMDMDAILHSYKSLLNILNGVGNNKEISE